MDIQNIKVKRVRLYQDRRGANVWEVIDSQNGGLFGRRMIRNENLTHDKYEPWENHAILNIEQCGFNVVHDSFMFA